MSATAESTAAPATSEADAGQAACATPCLSIERCRDGRCVPACPEGEVYVPATGPKGFTMGTGALGNGDYTHNVVLTKPFCMDALEVTAKSYQQCVEAGHCEVPRIWGMWINYGHKPDHPINKVHWIQAKTYCEQRGQTLPTEAQWEWAATGGDGRKWAWGDEPPSCTLTDYTEGVLPTPSGNAGCHGGGTSPVGSHPAGAKVWPDGKIHDLSGNVWEWCLDNYEPYTGKDEVDPLVFKGVNLPHVVRGGGWNRSHRGILAAYRGAARVNYQVPGLGFRCVRNPAPPGSSD